VGKFYLGVDGGQSSTKALIADEQGRVIGSGKAGPCNHVSGGKARRKFVTAVGDCLRNACAQAGLDFASVNFSAACFGFSGGAEDKEVFSREVIRSERYRFTHDADIALTGATAGRPGIIVIAGTGSMAFGRNEARQSGRAGGWGYIFGDEGSAFNLVRQALRGALSFEEGWGEPTILRERLLSATGAADANDLLHRFYTNAFPRDRIASLAPVVTGAACAGDRVAIDITRTAGAQLASLVHAVHQQLFRRFESVPVCYIGGVFRARAIRENFAAEVQLLVPCEVMPPLFDPAAGALIEALRVDGNKNGLLYVPESER
jgi:N-acetylglucosamine kinase-like BadF-type ATPase